MRYKKYWSRKRFQRRVEFFLFLPLSILARITPKANHEIYGSMNGFKVCDNSKFLFHNTPSKKSFFITKNKEACCESNDLIIYAYSFRGIYLQLRAKKIYWTHGLNDFIAPLVIGSYIVGLQHGLPGKKIRNANLSKVQIYKFRVKNILAPFMNNYFCQEVWSPREIYDPYIREVFYPLSVVIKRKQIPRIEFQPSILKEKKILYAPSHRAFRSFMDVINSNKIFSKNFIRELKENNIQLILRPHPINYEELLGSKINFPVEIDLTDDVHDTISSYSIVISDFSGLLIDCWELGIDTYCLCDDLEDVFERGMLFDWFFDHLKTVRVFDISEILQNPVFFSQSNLDQRESK
jgi:CDP-glycerol glycerophosphotransferase (TagB/SpsB family)